MLNLAGRQLFYRVTVKPGKSATLPVGFCGHLTVADISSCDLEDTARQCRLHMHGQEQLHQSSGSYDHPI